MNPIAISQVQVQKTAAIGMDKLPLRSDDGQLIANDPLALLSMYSYQAVAHKACWQDVEISISSYPSSTSETPAQLLDIWQYFRYERIAELLLPYLYDHIHRSHASTPPEHLASILSKALQDDQLLVVFLPHVDERASWVAGLHPLWQVFAGQISFDEWQKENPKTQIQMLAILRAVNLSAFHNFFKQYLLAASAKELLKYMQLFPVQLQAEDVALLTPYVGHRSRKVRKQIALLLLRNSQTDEAPLYHMLDDLFTYKKKSWHLRPEKKTEEKVQMSVDSLFFAWEGESLRSAAMTWVQHANPAYWIRRAQLSADELVQSMARSKDALAMLEALVQAAIHYRSSLWSDALVAFWLAQQGKSRWHAFDAAALIPYVSETAYQHLLQHQLPMCHEVLREQEPLFQLIATPNKTWSEKTSDVLIKQVDKWLKKAVPIWELHIYIQLFEHMCMKAPLTRQAAVMDIWQQAKMSMPRLAIVDENLQIIWKLRLQIHKYEQS